MTSHDVIQIEGLLEDVDFRTKVSRDDFEELCSDLFDRVGDPVRQALQATEITMVSNYSVVHVQLLSRSCVGHGTVIRGI